MASTCSQKPLSISLTRTRSASSMASSSSSFVLHRTTSADSADLAAIGSSAAAQFDSLVSGIRAKNDRRQRRAFYRSVAPQRVHRQVSLDQIDLDDVVDDFAVMSRVPSRTSSFGDLPPSSPSLKKSSSALASCSSSSLTVPDSSSSPMPAGRVRIRRANSDTVALDSPSGMHKKRVRANLAKAKGNSVQSPPGKKDIRVRRAAKSPDKRSSCPVSSPLKKSNSLTKRQSQKRSSEGMNKSSASSRSPGKAEQNGFSWRSTSRRSKRSRGAAAASAAQTEPDASSATSIDNSSSSSSQSSSSSKSTSSAAVNRRRSRSRTPVREDSSSDESDVGEISPRPKFPTSSKSAAIKPSKEKSDDSLYPLFPPSFYPKPPVRAAAPAKKRRNAPLSLSTSRRSSILTKEKKRGFFFDSDSEDEDAMADEDDPLFQRSSSSSGRFSSSLPSIVEESSSPSRRTRRKPPAAAAKSSSLSASQPVESTSARSSSKRKSSSSSSSSAQAKAKSAKATRSPMKKATRSSPMKKAVRSPNKRVRNDCSRLKESVSETMGSPPKKARVSRTTHSQGANTTAHSLSRANSSTRATGNASASSSSSSKNGVVKPPLRKRALSNEKFQTTKQEKGASRYPRKPSSVSSPQKQKQKTAVQKQPKPISRRTALSLSKKGASASSSNWMDDEDVIEESLAPPAAFAPGTGGGGGNEKEVDVFALPDQDTAEAMEVSAFRLTAFARQRGLSTGSIGDEPDSIRTMRMQNLSEKSNSALLLDALLQKHSRELQKVSRIASSATPGIRSMSRLSRRTESIRFDLDEDYKVLGKITPSLECTIMYLLDNGADPEYTDADGVFPLLVAVQYENSVRVVAKLLQSGASSERVFDDRSLVDVAWRLDQPLVCALLVKQNAFPTALSAKPGQATFLDYAKAHGFHQLALQRMKSLLWEGVECHSEDWIESALRHGVPPSVRDNSDQTPLYVAVHSKAPGSVVRLLLSRGADPNIVDASRTPMMCFPLIRHGKDALGIIKLLLKYSADTGARVGSTGQTLLDFALESGADPNYHSLLKEAALKNEQLRRKLHERKSSRTKKKGSVIK